MNQFGGNWTEAKMDIVVAYAKAYLTIMNNRDWVRTLYFDGFAGSGMINSNEEDEIMKGTALRILDIEKPKPFDIYYFVEKNEKYKNALKSIIDEKYFGKNANVVKADCNSKMIAMAEYLKKHKEYRALAFIDPYGMTVNWSSIESLKTLGVDLWILVLTGIGVNRLLKKDGNISEAWLKKLETFLGLSKEYIFNHFYRTKEIQTLFGIQTEINKEKDVINKIGQLYSQKLKTVFEYVSESFVMTNNTNSVMYHFMMATNKVAALNIANDVIKPKYKL